MNAKMKNMAVTVVQQQRAAISEGVQIMKRKQEAVGDNLLNVRLPVKWASRKSVANDPDVPLVTRLAQSWEVTMPPFKKQMVGGRLVPTLRRFLSQKSRRISIQIMVPKDQSPSTDDILHANEINALDDQDVVLISIMRPEKHRPEINGRESEEDSDNGLSTECSNESISGLDELYLWKSRAQYKLEDILVLKQLRHVCEIQLGSGNDTVVRDINFESEQDAADFQESLRKMKKLEVERAHRQMSLFRNDYSDSSVGERKRNRKHGLMGAGRITLLVEIVSASNLRAGAADPYVIVKMGGKEIHRTEFVPRTADPIWTLDHVNLFLLDMTPEEFFSCGGGMSFVVKDYDAIGSNPMLGQVSVSLHSLLESKGARNSFPLATGKSKKGQKVERSGTLYLRVKAANESDIEFMEAFKNNKKKAEVFLSETYVPLRAPKLNILKGQKKRGRNGESLCRVRPFPDPAREEGTKWLTKEEIERESLKPSTHWIEAGSGDLFRVYFEIIGCDNLPNMDSTTLNILDKTDTFANIAFEDALVNTDVISNSLSPRWMPWCHRAFAFNASHPSSDIFLSLFDFDPERSPAQLLSRAASDLHDRIGRVRINLAKLLPDTVYNLSYPLFLGGEIGKHRKGDRGIVHVRLRIESRNARKMLLCGLFPPKQSHLAVARQVDFEVAHFTVAGAAASGADKFSLPRFTGYIEELQSYQMVQESIQKAAFKVWLWRGHYKVKFFGRETMIPLHSMIAYSWSLLVTWNFNYLPAFLFFCVAWIMLASSEQMKQHPSKWHHSRGFFVLLRLMLLNSTSSESIKANENVKKINEFESETEDHLERWKRRKQHNRAAKKTFRSELRDQIGQAKEEISISTSKQGLLKGGVNVNPLNTVLFPVQRRLRKLVILLRIVKSIFLWEETYYAFWITVLGLVASLLSLFVPWDIIVKGILRTSALILLGPWMALVDRYYFGCGSTCEQDTAQWNRRWQRRYNRINRKAKKKRIRKENALKLKATMRFCFGKFLVSIPRFNEDLYRDKPLPASFAAPYDATSIEPIIISEKKYGQKLSGSMVMKRELQITTEAVQDARMNRDKTRKWRRVTRSQSEEDNSLSSDTLPFEVESKVGLDGKDPTLTRKVSFDGSEISEISEKTPLLERDRKCSRTSSWRRWIKPREEVSSEQEKGTHDHSMDSGDACLDK